MESALYDIAVVGGGIVGVATAAALISPGSADPLSPSTAHSGYAVIILETEDRLAAHQTGHNSGVIHSGLYYRPGSLKARNCAQGREALYRFCAERGIAHERCGKLVIATRAGELAALDELERRGRANGLHGLRRLTAEEIREREPAAAGQAGLLVPETGIVDFTAVTHALADIVRTRGGEIWTRARVRAVRSDGAHLRVETPRGEVRCRFLVNCAGLHADRVSRLCGIDPSVRILPFRGEYYELVAERRHLVRNLIYPVPDATLPFLGVHFTRRVEGRVEAGPNAVFALKREGYTKASCSARDLAESLSFPGFWRMSARFWRTGLGEYWRSFSKPAFVRALRRLVPDLQARDLAAGGAGVRAQAVDAAGRLLDDFCIIEAVRSLHVLNAPSPAATACLSIGRRIAEITARHLDPRAPV